MLQMLRKDLWPGSNNLVPEAHAKPALGLAQTSQYPSKSVASQGLPRQTIAQALSFIV